MYRIYRYIGGGAHFLGEVCGRRDVMVGAVRAVRAVRATAKLLMRI